MTAVQCLNRVHRLIVVEASSGWLRHWLLYSRVNVNLPWFSYSWLYLSSQLCPPSLCPPSLCPPSLCPPSLCLPSLCPPTVPAIIMLATVVTLFCVLGSVASLLPSPSPSCYIVTISTGLDVFAKSSLSCVRYQAPLSSLPNLYRLSVIRKVIFELVSNFAIGAGFDAEEALDSKTARRPTEYQRF